RRRGRVPAPAPRLHPWYGRPDHDRRSGPGDADTGGPEPRRPARHRIFVCQLPQGAAVLLRRGAAAARAPGHHAETAIAPITARVGLIIRSSNPMVEQE